MHSRRLRTPSGDSRESITRDSLFPQKGQCIALNAPIQKVPYRPRRMNPLQGQDCRNPGPGAGQCAKQKLNTPPGGCGHSHTPHLVEGTRDYHYPLNRCQSPVSTEIAYFFYNNRGCNCTRILLATTVGHRVIRNVIRRTNRVRVQEVCFPACWEQTAEIRLKASSKSRMRANSARRGRFCQSKSAGRHETPGRPMNQQDKPQ